jgi:hypothetical protein
VQGSDLLKTMVEQAHRGLKSKRGPSSSSALIDKFKWLSFADESFKFKKSSLYGTTSMICT